MGKLKTKTAAFFCAVMTVALLAGAALAAAEPENPQIVDLIQAYTPLDLTPYKGKALFINFFTEWCPYCMEEMDGIKKVYEDYNREELEIILVHAWDGEDASHTQSVKERFGMEGMNFYEDEQLELTAFLQLPGYPTSLFIDKEGYLIQAFPYAMSYENMASAVEGLGVSKAPATGGESAND